MLQAQGIMFMLVLVVLGFSPMIYRWAKRRDQQDAQRRELTGMEAAARHMYGEHVEWNPGEMQAYDRTPWMQTAWLIEARRRLVQQRHHAA